jgi:Rod binding domain-containing protein
MTEILPRTESPSASGSPSVRAKEQDSAEAFEKMFLSQMVDEMMKTVDMSSTMGEHASEMWRSVMSQSLAESLVDAGGLGVGENVYNILNAYKAGQDGAK